MTRAIPVFAEKATGEFDPFVPSHVSKVVVWLATDASAEISGQIFIVMGGGVHLIAPFSVAESLTKDGTGFSLEELDAGMPKLFAERSPGVPVFRGPSWS
jgi:hypothetical protein